MGNHILGRFEKAKLARRLVILGLDGAGKTTILYKMTHKITVESPIRTIGFNVETLKYKNFEFTCWDIGG